MTSVALNDVKLLQIYSRQKWTINSQIAKSPKDKRDFKQNDQLLPLEKNKGYFCVCFRCQRIRIKEYFKVSKFRRSYCYNIVIHNLLPTTTASVNMPLTFELESSAILISSFDLQLTVYVPTCG